MTSRSSKKLSFLIYDDIKGPVFVNTDKRKLNFVLYVLPIMTIIAMIVILIGSVYFKQIRESVRRKEPAKISLLKSKIQSLIIKEKELETLNQKFETKLSKGVNVKGSIPTLSLFRATAGVQDLSSTPILTIDEPTLLIDDKSISIKFDILNQTKNATRLTGYIHIIMSTANNMSFYPKSDISTEDMLISYNQGESFAFSRLRHVVGKFKRHEVDDQKALFKILIFSRTGDLLLKKLVAKDLK